MGLDVSHDCWSGAYSAFSRWRNEMARVAGYHVRPVSYDDHGSYETVLIDWGHLPDGCLDGAWPETPADPLMVLIAHQDCEGSIFRDQQIPLAERLEELAPLVIEPEGWNGHVGRNGGFAACALQFAKGLRDAYAADETVEFH